MSEDWMGKSSAPTLWGLNDGRWVGPFVYDVMHVLLSADFVWMLLDNSWEVVLMYAMHCLELWIFSMHEVGPDLKILFSVYDPQYFRLGR